MNPAADPLYEKNAYCDWVKSQILKSNNNEFEEYQTVFHQLSANWKKERRQQQYLQQQYEQQLYATSPASSAGPSPSPQPYASSSSTGPSPTQFKPHPNTWSTDPHPSLQQTSVYSSQTPLYVQAYQQLHHPVPLMPRPLPIPQKQLAGYNLVPLDCRATVTSATVTSAPPPPSPAAPASSILNLTDEVRSPSEDVLNDSFLKNLTGEEK